MFFSVRTASAPGGSGHDGERQKAEAESKAVLCMVFSLGVGAVRSTVGEL
jgi:hypothetical protein